MLKSFVRADGGNHGRVEIGLGQGHRGNRHLVAGIGFIVVDGMAGVGQRADAHAGRAAVGTDQAGAVERSGLSGQRRPVRLDGVVQHLVRLHDGIDADLKGEADGVAGGDAVGRTPAEDRPIGAQGGGVDDCPADSLPPTFPVKVRLRPLRSSSTRRL